ncbi:MAG: hypothetical protein CL878_05640 [Dehalococcoidia bacterium]|nr:hypothetical protein [Dehalococcoidia bacterium]
MLLLLVFGATAALAIGFIAVLAWRLRTPAPDDLASKTIATKPPPPASPLHHEAEQRALVLLRDLVTLADFERYLRDGYLAIDSPNIPGRVYVIPSAPGPVEVYEADRPVMRVCVQFVERMPHADSVVMHKLMIEADEHEYLRIANRV